jgi:hypothetical protein
VRDFRHSPTGGIRFSRHAHDPSTLRTPSFRRLGALFALSFARVRLAIAATVPSTQRDNRCGGNGTACRSNTKTTPRWTRRWPACRPRRRPRPITFGSYTSYQVNVNVLGNDIVGDARERAVAWRCIRSITT